MFSVGGWCECIAPFFVPPGSCEKAVNKQPPHIRAMRTELNTFIKMNDSTTYLTISESAERFSAVTESSLRRWIKSGKIPQDALLITESEHKAGRMVTLIDAEALKKIIAGKQRKKAPNESVASNGTNHVVDNWKQITEPFEHFIEYLKNEVEAQRLRAEHAEDRAQKAEESLRLLTHQPPSESKAEGKQNDGKRLTPGDVFLYVIMSAVAVVLIALLVQELKYKI